MRRHDVVAAVDRQHKPGRIRIEYRLGIALGADVGLLGDAFARAGQHQLLRVGAENTIEETAEPICSSAPETG